MTPAKLLLNLTPPVVVIVLAWWLAPHAADLPPSLSGLKGLGAYAVLVLGGVAGLVFRRGRIVFALLTLTLPASATDCSSATASPDFARTRFIRRCACSCR